jgi:hypothetical protein
MPDLTTPTDRDLLLNLWLMMTIASEQFDIDEDTAVLLACHADEVEPAPPAAETTLAALMAEIERRLEIEVEAIDVTTERLN